MITLVHRLLGLISKLLDDEEEDETEIYGSFWLGMIMTKVIKSTLNCSYHYDDEDNDDDL